MKKLLWITPYPIYTNVGDAGSKTVNYYYGRFKQDGDFDAALAFTGDEKSPGFKSMILEHRESKIFYFNGRKPLLTKIADKVGFMIYPILKKFIPLYYSTNGFVKRRTKQILALIHESGFKPDIIVVEFTPLILWIDTIRLYYPKAIIVASCHDVTYLSVRRFFNVDDKLNFATIYYRHFKKIEIAALNKFNLLLFLNEKDKKLVVESQSFKSVPTIVVSPYFSYYKINKSTIPDEIIFLGAMQRPENYTAVAWFLANVWDSVLEKKPNAKFLVIGGGLPDRIKRSFLEYHQVQVLGYVEDIASVLSNAMCLVAPLKLGAGIKVKVLEAMGAGVVVLTNNVGIEGIPAIHQQNYLHCDTARDYIMGIVDLFDNSAFKNRLEQNSTQMVKTCFNFDDSYQSYKAKILSLSSYDN
jgi:glycosyltransferase involved in cell wall biosynthesis